MHSISFGDKRQKLKPGAETVRRSIYFTSSLPGDECDQETHDLNQTAY